MSSREIFEKVQRVYGRLADDVSRDIYAARFFYNLSGSDKFEGNDDDFMWVDCKMKSDT